MKMSEIIISSFEDGHKDGFKDCLDKFLELKKLGKTLEEIELDLKNTYFKECKDNEEKN